MLMDKKINSRQMSIKSRKTPRWYRKEGNVTPTSQFDMDGSFDSLPRTPLGLYELAYTRGHRLGGACRSRSIGIGPNPTCATDSIDRCLVPSTQCRSLVRAGSTNPAATQMRNAINCLLRAAAGPSRRRRARSNFDEREVGLCERERVSGWVCL